MVDTKAVSVRLPLDLLNELNSYATDKGMVRGGDANIGGAIIAILRERFGEPDNVKQVSDNVDIDSIVNIAVESRLEAVLSQVENLRFDVNSVKTDDLLYDNLRTNLTVLQGKIEIIEHRSEVSAPAAPDVDIESIVNDAVRSKVLELREEFIEHEEIYKSQCQKGFELQIATFREEMNEAIATAKKPLLSVMRAQVAA